MQSANKSYMTTVRLNRSSKIGCLTVPKTQNVSVKTMLAKKYDTNLYIFTISKVIATIMCTMVREI